MRDWINIDTVPYDEECVQVGEPNYMAKSHKEAVTMIKQLKRMYGEPPKNASFNICLNPHDFGSYLDIRVYYDDEDEASEEYAFNCENMPDVWDDIAREELGI